MSDIARRKGELMRALFDLLLKTPDGIQAKDALKALEQKIELTPHEKGFYKSGARRFEKIVRFSTIVFVKAGWLVKAKGLWSVTPDGQKAYIDMPDPEKFHMRARKLYLEWKAKQPDASSVEDEDSEDSDEEGATISFDDAEAQARSRISDFLKVMPPYEFQELVACLLRAMGYYVSWITRTTR